MELNCVDVERSLKNKGFEQVSGDHRRYKYPDSDVGTKVSHNSQPIGEDLIRKMRFQMHLEKKEFLDFVNCPFTKEQYRKKLITEGRYPKPQPPAKKSKKKGKR